MTELIAGLAVALSADQLSKLLVVSALGEGEIAPGRPEARLRLRRLTNPRPGFTRVGGAWMLFALWLLVATTALLPTFSAPPAQLGLGCALGGAAGNMVDRCRRGAVIDFLDVRIWPVFNLADVAIVLGLAVALLWAQVGGS